MAILVPKPDQEIAALAPVQSVSGRTGDVSTLQLASDLNLSTLASKAYVDGLVSSVVTFTGTTDCSSNPNYPVAGIGDAFVVSVGGKIGGASGVDVSPGDVFIATVTNAGGSQESVGDSWTVVQHTLQGALLSENNLSDITDATAARENLGLVLGTDVLSPTGNGSGLTGITSSQVSGLGTLSSQNSNNVSVTGGTITGISDLSISDGGTGASTAADARTNLGLVIGADVLSPTGDGSGLTGLTPASVGLSSVTNNAQTLAAIVPNTAPASGQLLVGNSGGTAYSPVSLSGDATITSSGVVSLANSGTTRANLGLSIGTDVLSPTGSGASLTGITQSQVGGLVSALAGKQPLNSTLTTISSAASPTNLTRLGNATAATTGQWFYAVDTNTFGVAGSQTFGRSLVNTASSAAARTTLGLGTISTQASTAISVTGGTITGITDLAIADGGTGSSTAAGARTNLGLVIGTDVLAPTGNGSGLTGLTNTQISGLGTMSTQSSSSVSITGGSITGITDLPVADGGTGSSTAAGARTNLGLVIGTDVLAPTGNGSSLTGITQSQVSGLTTTLAAKADLVGGVVPSSQIPSVAITEFLGSVSSQSAMTALSGQKGDWCIRTDAQMAYFIVGDDPTIAANWTAIPHPSSPVLTVNGQTGTVVLGYADVGAQASDATLTGLASVVTAADKLIYASGSDTFTTCDLTSTARTLLDDTSTSAMRTTLGLGTIATQDSSSVSITGGTITGITDLAVADGGTGASDASTARTNLGLVIGTDVLAPNGSGASLTGITATQVGLGSVTNDAQTKASVVPNTAPTAGQILVGNAGGTAYGVVSASGDATISSTGAITLTNDSSTRSNLGLGSMATQSSSSVSITGGSITGITDLPVADGGTGASTAATARSNLGVAVSNNNWFDSAPAVGTITWVSKSRVAFTIGGVYGVKTTSGTCTFAVKINGTAVTGLSAVAATSSTQDVTASGGNSVAIGDAITIEYTAASSPVNLCFTLEATR